jgi:O-antigen ligase
VKTTLSLQRSASYLIYGIVTTIPLIFGAVHPIVLGCYVFVMLVGLGGWLLLNQSEGGADLFSLWSVVPVILIVYLILQSLPLPFEWVEIVSPSRAERVRIVNELAGTDQQRITLSDNGIVGLYRSFSLLALMCYYFGLKKLLAQDQKYTVILVHCLVVVGAFEALYGLVQFVSPHIGILWLSIKSRAAHGTIIYKNQYASLLNMIWPLAVASGAIYFAKNKKDSRFRSLSQFFAAGMMVLAVLFSLSRGGILAMGLVALLLVVTLPFPRIKKIFSLALFVLFIGGYGAMMGLDTVVTRFDSLGSSGTHRIDIYLSSLPMLMDHWLTGIGVGSYTLLSPVYLKGFPVNIHYDRVHNEYLEVMIELGIPMAIFLFGWLLAGMVRIGIALTSPKLRSELGFNRIALGSAAFCGLIGFLVHGVADFGWRLPVNLVYGVTLFAIAICSLSPEAPSKENIDV